MLVACCFWTPWELSFEVESKGAVIFDWSIDGVFLLDMFIIFFSAHTNEDFEVIDDHKEIAITYLLGNFWIDLLAILPFQHMVAIFDDPDARHE